MHSTTPPTHIIASNDKCLFFLFNLFLTLIISFEPERGTVIGNIIQPANKVYENSFLYYVIHTVLCNIQYNIYDVYAYPV